jgi:hypothetical protein
MPFGDYQTESGIYFCKECNKLYNECYELEHVLMCIKCWSEVKFIPEIKIKAFIRNKRLKKLKEIFDSEKES